MKNFTDWLIELIEDEHWHENASRYHSKETFEKVANQVYVLGISDSQTFFLQPMKEHRNHVYNKLCKLPHDKPKKNWVEESLKEAEAKKKATEPEWKPVSWEERAKRLEEFQAMIDNSPMMKPVAPLTAKEKIENQGWRPKPQEVKEPSEVEKRSAYIKHLQRVRQSRSMLFLEAYPNAEPEEVQAYLDKFKSIDDPLSLL